MGALLLHRPNEILLENGKYITKTLDKLKEEKLINKTGISIYSPEEIKPILDKYNFDIVQTPMNILDRRILESGWLQKLKENNIDSYKIFFCRDRFL